MKSGVFIFFVFLLLGAFVSIYYFGMFIEYISQKIKNKKIAQPPKILDKIHIATIHMRDGSIYSIRKSGDIMATFEKRFFIPDELVMSNTYLNTKDISLIKIKTGL